MFNFAKLFDFFISFRQNFKTNFFDPLFFWYIKIYLSILLFINIIIWLIAGYLNMQMGEGLMALHYNVDFGINLIGEANKIYIIPLLGIIIIIINTLLFILVSRHKDKIFISHILFITALIANIILLVSTASIYLINFR